MEFPKTPDEIDLRIRNILVNGKHFFDKVLLDNEGVLSDRIHWNEEEIAQMITQYVCVSHLNLLLKQAGGDFSAITPPEWQFDKVFYDDLSARCATNFMLALLDNSAALQHFKQSPHISMDDPVLLVIGSDPRVSADGHSGATVHSALLLGWAEFCKRAFINMGVEYTAAADEL